MLMGNESYGTSSISVILSLVDENMRSHLKHLFSIRELENYIETKFRELKNLTDCTGNTVSLRIGTEPTEFPELKIIELIFHQLLLGDHEVTKVKFTQEVTPEDKKKILAEFDVWFLTNIKDMMWIYSCKNTHTSPYDFFVLFLTDKYPNLSTKVEIYRNDFHKENCVEHALLTMVYTFVAALLSKAKNFLKRWIPKSDHLSTQDKDGLTKFINQVVPEGLVVENVAIAAFTALVHDVGKHGAEHCFEYKNIQGVMFKGHAEIGAALLNIILPDDFPKRDLVIKAADLHMCCGYHGTESEWFRGVQEALVSGHCKVLGSEFLSLLFALSVGDSFGTSMIFTNEKFSKKLETIQEWYSSCLDEFAFGEETSLLSSLAPHVDPSKRGIYLSGTARSGKTTLANGLKEKLKSQGVSSVICSRDIAFIEAASEAMKKLPDGHPLKVEEPTYADLYKLKKDPRYSKKINQETQERFVCSIITGFSEGKVVIVDTCMPMRFIKYHGKPVFDGAIVYTIHCTNQLFNLEMAIDRVACRSQLDDSGSVSHGCKQDVLTALAGLRQHFTLSRMNPYLESKDMRYYSKFPNSKRPNVFHPGQPVLTDCQTISPSGVVHSCLASLPLFMDICKQANSLQPRDLTEFQTAIEIMEDLVETFHGSPEEFVEYASSKLDPHKYTISWDTKGQTKVVKVNYYEGAVMGGEGLSQMRGLVFYIDWANREVYQLSYNLPRGPEAALDKFAEEKVDHSFDRCTLRQQMAISALLSGADTPVHMTGKDDGCNSNLVVHPQKSPAGQALLAYINESGSDFQKKVMRAFLKVTKGKYVLCIRSRNAFVDGIGPLLMTAIAASRGLSREDVTQKTWDSDEVISMVLIPFLDMVYRYLEEKENQSGITLVFELVPESRSDWWGSKTFPELACSSLPGIYHLGDGTASGYEPAGQGRVHFPLRQKPFWSFTSGDQVRQLLRDLDRYLRGIITRDQFFEENPPANTGNFLHQVTPEGFCLQVTLEDGTSVYLKYKTQAFYHAHAKKLDVVAESAMMYRDSIQPDAPLWRCFPIFLQLLEIGELILPKLGVLREFVLGQLSSLPEDLVSPLGEKVRTALNKMRDNGKPLSVISRLILNQPHVKELCAEWLIEKTLRFDHKLRFPKGDTAGKIFDDVRSGAFALVQALILLNGEEVHALTSLTVTSQASSEKKQSNLDRVKVWVPRIINFMRYSDYYRILERNSDASAAAGASKEE